MVKKEEMRCEPKTGKNLLLCHLVPEPVTEPMAAGGVSGAADAPHKREEKPGLDELLQAVELLLGYRLPSLQVNGEINPQ